MPSPAFRQKIAGAIIADDGTRSVIRFGFLMKARQCACRSGTLEAIPGKKEASVGSLFTNLQVVHASAVIRTRLCASASSVELKTSTEAATKDPAKPARGLHRRVPRWKPQATPQCDISRRPTHSSHSRSLVKQRGEYQQYANSGKTESADSAQGKGVPECLAWEPDQEGQ